MLRMLMPFLMAHTLLHVIHTVLRCVDGPADVDKVSGSKTWSLPWPQVMRAHGVGFRENL